MYIQIKASHTHTLIDKLAYRRTGYTTKYTITFHNRPKRPATIANKIVIVNDRD